MNVVYCFFKLYDIGWRLENVYSTLEAAQNVFPHQSWAFSDDCKRWHLNPYGGYRIEEREVKHAS